jgi:chromosome segregation ATPase
MLAVEKERLTKEAAQRHSTAIEETRRLLSEAEDRAGAAEQRAAEATTMANRQRSESAAEAERIVSRARREAEQLVTSARQQAAQIGAHGQADAQRALVSTRHELAALQKRRDSIVAQLASLRDLVATFRADEDEATPQSDPAQSDPAQSDPEPSDPEPSDTERSDPEQDRTEPSDIEQADDPEQTQVLAMGPERSRES